MIQFQDCDIEPPSGLKNNPLMRNKVIKKCWQQTAMETKQKVSYGQYTNTNIVKHPKLMIAIRIELFLCILDYN